LVLLLKTGERYYEPCPVIVKFKIAKKIIFLLLYKKAPFRKNLEFMSFGSVEATTLPSPVNGKYFQKNRDLFLTLSRLKLRLLLLLDPISCMKIGSSDPR